MTVWVVSVCHNYEMEVDRVFSSAEAAVAYVASLHDYQYHPIDEHDVLEAWPRKDGADALP